MPKRRGQGDGGLYYLPDRGLWRGVVDLGRDHEGKRMQKSVTARDRKACLAKLKRLQADLEANGGILPDKVPTLAVWAHRWLDTRAVHEVDPHTYGTYASLARRWIIPALGARRLDQIRPSDVAALRAVIVEQGGRSTATARQAQVVLSRMLAAAVADRHIRENPCVHVRKARGGAVDRAALPTEDAVRLLKAAADMPRADGARWWLKLLAGLRQTEILGATLADLDMDAGTYAVSWKLEAVPRAHGCGGDCGKRRGADCPAARWRISDGFEMRHLTGQWCLTRPKSRTGRIVPLVPDLTEAIRRNLTAHADEPNPHGLIWRHPDGSPITPKQDADQWRRLLVAAGLITAAEAKPGGTLLTGHWARHTTVTVLAEQGVDFQLIGEIVGHSSEQVTRIYRHARDSEKRAAMEALAGAWKQGLAIES